MTWYLDGWECLYGRAVLRSISSSHWMCLCIVAYGNMRKNWIKWQCGKWNVYSCTQYLQEKRPSSSTTPFLAPFWISKILAMTHFNHFFEFNFSNTFSHQIWYFVTKCVKPMLNSFSQLQIIPSPSYSNTCNAKWVQLKSIHSVKCGVKYHYYYSEIKHHFHASMDYLWWKLSRSFDRPMLMAKVKCKAKWANACKFAKSYCKC